jgi:14-3-3 protein epsilon
MVMVICVV